jgi:hypothetical protein
MDFDDLLMITAELFAAFPDVLSYYQEKFRYVLVDEYQDTNHAQYRIVQQLAERHRNLCVVGDSDQSIYRFRGADIRNILEFERDYRDARVVLLAQNCAANAVIDNNRSRKPKRLWTDLGRGEEITLYEAEDEHDEAAFVAEQALAHEQAGGRLSDLAVFYRTNAQSRVLEEVFVRFGVPYQVIGGPKFYDRREVKDAFAYLRVLTNPSDQVALKRIINVPKRGIVTPRRSGSPSTTRSSTPPTSLSSRREPRVRSVSSSGSSPCCATRRRTAPEPPSMPYSPRPATSRPSKPKRPSRHSVGWRTSRRSPRWLRSSKSPVPAWLRKVSPGRS